MSKKPYEGASEVGNFQEALEKAISSAEAGEGHNVKWELQKVSGQTGGTVGNRIVVAIVAVS